MAKRISLDGGSTVVDDDFDAGVLPRLYIGNHGYVAFSHRGSTVLLHRWLTLAPKGTHVDHINGDKLDNRRHNLRVVTPQINQVNRHRLTTTNTSGVRGVVHVPRTSARNPWRAQITVKGQNISTGYFATRGEATVARRQAELAYWGESCPIPREGVA
jgi:hypothetical protein